MDFDKLSSRMRMTKMIFTFIRGGLGDEYIESRLWASRDSQTSMTDITELIAKCRAYQPPNFSVSFSEQPKHILFKDRGELDLFCSQYKTAMRYIGCCISWDNLTMTI